MKDFDIENFPISESAKEMLHTASEDFYEHSYVYKWILQVLGVEWDNAKKIIAGELADQFFIETATWGLRYHEEKWGLPVREYLSYEQRRALLYEKRDYKPPMTPYAMEEYIKKAIPDIEEVHVMDCHDAGEDGFQPEHPNIFKVILVADDLDLKSATRLIKKIKQSHTTFSAIEWRKVYNLYGDTKLAGAISAKKVVTIN